MRGGLKVLLQLLQLVGREFAWLVLSVLLGFLNVVSNVGLMTVSAFLISEAALRVPISTLSLSIVGVRFFGISRAVFRYAERYFSHSAAFRIISRIRVGFYRRLEPMVPEKVMGLHSGELFSRMVQDAECLKEFFLRAVHPFLVFLLMIVPVGAFAGMFNADLAISVIALFLITGLAVPFFTALWGRKLGEKGIQTKAELNTTLVESLSGISEILSHNREQAWRCRLETVSGQWALLQQKFSVCNGFANAFAAISGSLGIWMVLLLCIPLVSAGKLQGQLLAAISLGLAGCFEAVLPLQQLHYRLEESGMAAARLFDLSRGDIHEEDSYIANQEPHGFSIIIRDLGVRYQTQGDWVVESLDLELQECRKIAVVGPNGCGKSTLLQALLGFVSYEKGEILIGNRNVKQLRSDYLREFFSVVPQQPYLFHATIRDNLSISDPKAPEEKLLEALKTAQIHDFVVSLPHGLDTPIWEGGYKLSGGQRQRLAVARALLRDRPVMLLDEVTAGLDPVTERNLLQTVFKVCDKKSLIMITHRLTGMELMDEILVMGQGKIAERGTHDQLIGGKGLYWRMWHRHLVETEDN
jgi:ATP-binding cassette, subfamily C, bacterial CydC